MLPQLRELVTSSEAQPLLVLNHGDCWNNNLLFKKHPKTGQVYDQIFVDLQVTNPFIQLFTMFDLIINNTKHFT